MGLLFKLLRKLLFKISMDDFFITLLLNYLLKVKKNKKMYLKLIISIKNY